MNVKKKLEKKQVVTYAEEVVGVTIELTIKEAEDLNRIFYHIGGSTKDSPRETSDKLSEEFDELGIGRSPVAPETGMQFRLNNRFA